MNFCEKISIWIKFIFYKFWKRLNLPPFWSTIRISLPLVWNQLWRRCRNTWLQAWLVSLVFISVKFYLVIHTKCWKVAFCVDYEAKFTEVKQVRWVKRPEVTRSWIYVTILSMSILWSAARIDPTSFPGPFSEVGVDRKKITNPKLHIRLVSLFLSIWPINCVANLCRFDTKIWYHAV